MARAYQRARSPEQKAQRTEQILSTAETMLAEGQAVTSLSLNELARRAGMAKSNVYRYFESREAILLALLEERTKTWAAEAAHELASIDRRRSVAHRIETMASIMAHGVGKRPVMCHLISVLPSVLEHNVSMEVVRAYKLASLTVMHELAGAMQRSLPELALEAHGELLHHAFAFIVGSWPLAHPAPMVVEALQIPELAEFNHDFERDLTRVVTLMARGMLAGT